VHLDAKSPTIEYAGEQLGDGTLARSARDEQGVSRIDANERPRERDGVA